MTGGAFLRMLLARMRKLHGLPQWSRDGHERRCRFVTAGAVVLSRLRPLPVTVEARGESLPMTLKRIRGRRKSVCDALRPGNRLPSIINMPQFGILITYGVCRRRRSGKPHMRPRMSPRTGDNRFRIVICRSNETRKHI